MTSITINMTTVDIADRRHPEKSGRYISLVQLLTVLGDMQENDIPLSELVYALREMSR